MIDIEELRRQLGREVAAVDPRNPVRYEQVRSRVRRRRARGAATASVAVLALTAGSAALIDGGRSRVIEPAGQGPSSTIPSDSRADIVVLETEGWSVVTASGDPGSGGSITYRAGRRSLHINWVDEALYDSRLEDRRSLDDRGSGGRDVVVLGRPGQVWSYSAQDHTVLLEPRGGQFIEARADGMGRQKFLHLLDELAVVDDAGYAAGLPPRFIDDDERTQAVDAMLAQIAAQVAPAPVLPPGTPRAAVDSVEVDPYNVGADVAGAVACAWVNEHLVAVEDGDASRAAVAVQVMGTARRWTVLQQMDDSGGDFPEVVWTIAEEIADGQVVRGVEGQLGCGG